MSLTRDYKESVKAGVQRELEFIVALLDEAVYLLVNGEPETAWLILQDLANEKRR